MLKDGSLNCNNPNLPKEVREAFSAGEELSSKNKIVNKSWCCW